MSRTTVAVRKVGARKGWIRALDVQGPWEPECSERFWAEECGGIIWRPPKAKDQSCDHLAAFRAKLRYLSITAGRTMDDSAIAGLYQLDHLDALTRARNALDLSALSGLWRLNIDDRPALHGFAQPALEGARFFSERRLQDLEPAARLFALELKGSRTRTVDLRARLPVLARLTVETSPVVSLEGLDAPNLESLHLVGRKSDHVLDLAPLSRLPKLRWVTVAGPRALRNARPLTERPGFTLRTQAELEP